MKKIKYLPLTLISIAIKAWQSLKEWCDPAMEGDPYALEKSYKSYRTRSNWSNRPNWSYFGHRYVIQKS